MWDVKFYFFLKNPDPFGIRKLEACRLLLDAWCLSFNSLKNFSQLARYDAGSNSCGAMK